MRVDSVEIFSEASNYAIMRPPGRRFPGCVIQGDSLSMLVGTAKNLALRLQTANVADEEALDAAEELLEQLLGRLLHDQEVLDEHGIRLPYFPRFSEDDMIRLVPEDESDETGSGKG